MGHRQCCAAVGIGDAARCFLHIVTGGAGGKSCRIELNHLIIAGIGRFERECLGAGCGDTVHIAYFAVHDFQSQPLLGRGESLGVDPYFQWKQFCRIVCRYGKRECGGGALTGEGCDIFAVDGHRLEAEGPVLHQSDGTYQVILADDDAGRSCFVAGGQVGDEGGNMSHAVVGARIHHGECSIDYRVSRVIFDQLHSHAVVVEGAAVHVGVIAESHVEVAAVAGEEKEGLINLQLPHPVGDDGRLADGHLEATVGGVTRHRCFQGGISRLHHILYLDDIVVVAQDIPTVSVTIEQIDLVKMGRTTVGTLEDREEIVTAVLL